MTIWKREAGAEGTSVSADLCIISLDTPQVPQVTLVTHKHDDDVGVSMVTQLLEPSLHILKGHCIRHKLYQSLVQTLMVCS